MQVEGIKRIFISDIARVSSAVLARPALLLLIRGIFLWFQSIKSWFTLSWALLNRSFRLFLFISHLDVNFSLRLLRNFD